MNVVVEIGDRKAIPVRALPLLTSWTTMSPDEVVAAFAGDAYHWQFQGMHAHRIESGVVLPIADRWWANFPRRALRALSDRIEERQISDETGYQDWQRESLAVLPAGTFVWKDEFEPAYYRAFGPEGTTFASDTGATMPEDEQVRHVALDYCPFIPDPQIVSLVMEGFEPNMLAASPHATAKAGPSRPTEGKVERQDRRLKQCLDAGLPMDKRALFRLPNGVGLLANREGVSRQAFSADIRAALERKRPA